MVLVGEPVHRGRIHRRVRNLIRHYRPLRGLDTLEEARALKPPSSALQAVRALEPTHQSRQHQDRRELDHLPTPVEARSRTTAAPPEEGRNANVTAVQASAVAVLIADHAPGSSAPDPLHAFDAIPEPDATPGSVELL
jgi:hypothetical protein